VTNSGSPSQASQTTGIGFSALTDPSQPAAEGGYGQIHAEEWEQAAAQRAVKLPKVPVQS